MAAGNVSRIIRAPGRIVIDPTNLSNAYPHGGTEVGKSNLCVVQSTGTPFRVESEGLGEATDILESEKRYVFSCFMRGWDDDGVLKWFSNASVVSTGATQHARFTEPGTRVPGESTSTRSVILLYVPDDLIHSMAVLVYNGIPDWAEGLELALQRGTEFGLPIAVDCMRDTNNNMIQMGRFADLSLT